jgi:hypothetical protein
MPPGDERRRTLAALVLLVGWVSPGTIEESLGVNRSTVTRMLKDVSRWFPLERRRRGRVVEYRHARVFRTDRMVSLPENGTVEPWNRGIVDQEPDQMPP